MGAKIQEIRVEDEELITGNPTGIIFVLKSKKELTQEEFVKMIKKVWKKAGFLTAKDLAKKLVAEYPNIYENKKIQKIKNLKEHKKFLSNSPSSISVDYKIVEKVMFEEKFGYTKK